MTATAGTCVLVAVDENCTSNDTAWDRLHENDTAWTDHESTYPEEEEPGATWIALGASMGVIGVGLVVGIVVAVVALTHRSSSAATAAVGAPFGRKKSKAKVVRTGDDSLKNRKKSKSPKGKSKKRGMIRRGIKAVTGIGSLAHPTDQLGGTDSSGSSDEDRPILKKDGKHR